MRTSKIQLALISILLIPCWIIAWNFDIDLVNLHAAMQFAHSDLSRVYAQNGNLGRWFYPPLTVVLFYPLGGLSYQTVKIFWIGVQTLAFVAFWFGLYRLYPKFKLSPFFWPWLFVFIVAINPIHNNFQSNNIQLMLFSLLIWAEIFSGEQGGNYRPLTAGLLVALASWVKVFPAFMAVYYMMVKPHKVRAGLVLGFFLGLVLPLVFFGSQNGVHLYEWFYQGLTTYSDQNKSPDIMCLPTLVERVFTYLIPLSSSTVSFVSKSLTLAISGAFFLWILRYKARSKHTWALAMALTVFLNPSTRPHYFIFFVPAFASILEITWQEKQIPALLLLGLAVTLVAFTTDAVLGKSLNDRVESLSLPTIGSGLASFLLAYLLAFSGGVFGGGGARGPYAFGSGLGTVDKSARQHTT